jgi:hypothetical protein
MGGLVEEYLTDIVAHAQCCYAKIPTFCRWIDFFLFLIKSCHWEGSKDRWPKRKGESSFAFNRVIVVSAPHINWPLAPKIRQPLRKVRKTRKHGKEAGRRVAAVPSEIYEREPCEAKNNDHLQSRPKSHRGVPGRAGLRAIVGLENPMRMFPLAKSRLAQTRHCSWSELVTFAHGTPTHVAYYERAHRIKRQSKTASGQGRLRARSRACLCWV